MRVAGKKLLWAQLINGFLFGSPIRLLKNRGGLKQASFSNVRSISDFPVGKWPFMNYANDRKNDLDRCHCVHLPEGTKAEIVRGVVGDFGFRAGPKSVSSYLLESTGRPTAYCFIFEASVRQVANVYGFSSPPLNCFG